MSEPNKELYLHNIPAGCLVFNLDASIVYVNHTLSQMLGYASEELVGKSVEKIFSISSRIFYQTHFFPLLRLQGEVTEIFLSLKGKDGTTVPVMVNATVQNEDGDTTYLCILVVVTERQKYEQQLLAAQKAQQKLLEENQLLIELKQQLESNQLELDRKISIYKQLTTDLVQMGKALMHDMQEPIRKISFFANTLTQQSDRNHPDSRTFEIIETCASRLRKLIDSLLDFVDISILEEQVSWLSLRDLVEQARQQASQELGFDEFEVIILSDTSFEGKRNALQKVFTELIKNAVKNRDASRALRISVSAIIVKENVYQVNPDKYKYTDHVHIQIADNGQGFDMHYSAYIFGLLNKLDPSTEGVGLGLALCRQIISYHFGRIMAVSVPDQGTTFTIQLPVSPYNG